MKKIILLFIAIVISSVAFSQTAYQTKCAQIFKKYWNLFCPGYPMSNFEMNMIGVYENAKNYLKIGALDYAMKTGKNIETLFAQMEKEYAEARKLMTQREQADYRVEEERKTNFGKQKWDAVLEFVKWGTKGEYETTAQYEDRLNNESATVFDEKLYNHIREFVIENPWTFEFGKYNADKQELYVKFYDKIKENSWGHYLENCPPDYAESLKENCSSYGDFPYYNNGNFTLDLQCGLTFSYDISNLQTDGKDFIPDVFTFETKSEIWTLKNEPEGSGNVVIKYDDLRLQEFDIVLFDKYLKGHVFDYNKVAIAVEEQKRIIVDSLNLCIEAEISRIDKVLAQNEYNILHYTLDSAYKQLFERYARHSSPYIATEETLSKYSKYIVDDDVTNGETIESVYQTKVKYIEEAYQIAKAKIKNYYTATYNKYKDLFQSEDEFVSFYCKGEAILSTEINRRIDELNAKKQAEEELRQVKNELDRNRKSISEVNFQKDISNVSLSNVLNVAQGGQATDYSGVNQYRHQLIDWVRQKKDKPYYDYIVNFLIDNNIGLNKEYKKNGSCFSSKIEFYESFISGNYKDILKSKKK